VRVEPTDGYANMALSRNAKTGLILAAVALAFFAAIVAKYWLLR
jgi:hypothetical protein